MTAKTPATFAVSGLAVGTAYDVYAVAKESTYQTTSNVAGPIQFSTAAKSTSSIVIDPSTPTTLYAALDGSGVYTSTNSGASWTSITTAGLTNLNVRALVIQNSNTLFAATYDGGVFKGTLGAGFTTWAACGTGLGAARLRTLNMDASGNLYAGSETGVFKGNSACAGWVAMNTGLPN
jgi:ligand-binding sensor domain-containing protein